MVDLKLDRTETRQHSEPGLAVGSHGRILLVEDDSVIQRLIIIMLEGAGYSVVCAQDGEEGWNAIDATNTGFDLIITDNNMPKLSGLDLIRRLRSLSFNLPVILISGEIPRHAKDLDKLLTPGVALEKPFSMTQLLTHVKNTLAAVGSFQ